MISSYPTMLAIAAVITFLVALVTCKQRGFSAGRAATVLVSSGVAAVVGARLFDIAVDRGAYAEVPSRVYSLKPSGFALFGGLIVGALVGLGISLALDMDVWRVADACTPALGLGIATARIGCFLEGCCFGTTTSGPMGVVFPPGSPAALWETRIGAIIAGDQPLPVYPTQLYELVAALACAALATWILSRDLPDGTAFLTFVAAFSALRWINSGLRVLPATYTAPGWFYPLLYLGLIVLCMGLVAYRRAAQLMLVSADSDAQPRWAVTPAIFCRSDGSIRSGRLAREGLEGSGEERERRVSSPLKTRHRDANASPAKPVSRANRPAASSAPRELLLRMGGNSEQLAAKHRSSSELRRLSNAPPQVAPDSCRHPRCTLERGE